MILLKSHLLGFFIEIIIPTIAFATIAVYLFCSIEEIKDNTKHKK